jgi:hypothetical protein
MSIFSIQGNRVGLRQLPNAVGGCTGAIPNSAGVLGSMVVWIEDKAHMILIGQKNGTFFSEIGLFSIE